MPKLFVLAVLSVVAHNAYGEGFLNKLLAESSNDAMQDLVNDPCFNKINKDVMTCFNTKVPKYDPTNKDPAYTCCVTWNEIDCITPSAKYPPCTVLEVVKLVNIETKLVTALEATGKSCEKHKFATPHTTCPMT
ncbi:unnamed protein product [Medioppia subpectinata]|uniref:Uncharacterized protein n=1 Tax=Medioppia subpectinata TaxID=1979941 RepID=A0A7R9L682_9ACAR|nr:unnamed protein product [Medioppia subpectinata]CAG2116266.1 unnamed protein product [Medioppia subpectinata]